MTVVMAVDKRCTASGRALQAESAASEIQRGKIHLLNILQNRSKMHERRFAVMRVRYNTLAMIFNLFAPAAHFGTFPKFVAHFDQS